MVDYARVRMITIPEKVEDLPGLYRDLRTALFNVVNVAHDERGTYLYLDQSERKDPRPVVRAWVGKKLKIQRPTTSIFLQLLRKIW